MRTQTVFSYPDSETSLKILDLIFAGRTQEAYDILSGFYYVPKVKVNIDREKLPSNIKTDFLSAVAIYEYKIECSCIHFIMTDAHKVPHVVLHEFYHHLETAFELRGDKVGGNQPADSWAEWFVRSIKDVGASIYVMIGGVYFNTIRAMRMISFLKAVKNGDKIERIRKLKKHKEFLTTKEVFYSRVEKKYYLTSTGEKLLGYGIMYLDEWVKRTKLKREKEKLHDGVSDDRS